MSDSISVGVITVSDRAAAGEYADRGGPALCKACDDYGWKVEAEAVIPDDLKKIINDNSGAAISSAIGEAWNSIEPIGQKIATDKGNGVSQLSEAESIKFSAASASVIDRWVCEVTDKGIDG